MDTQYYKIAEHIVKTVMPDDIAGMMTNYEPFLTEEGEEATSLVMTDEEWTADFIEEWKQEDECSEIICGHTGEQPVYIFRWGKKMGGIMVCEKDYSHATLHLTKDFRKATVDNGMMVLYALAMSKRSTLLFHSSTVSHGGKAYMFLGVSGTGKSTHSRLWLKNIEDAELINDDNPVVRRFPNGTVMVYGTPWSGKTACYKNVAFPLGGLVALSQAPHNIIERVKGLQAYIIIAESISGKRWDKGVADGIHNTVNAIAKEQKIWHLDCLPDDDAAMTCCKAVSE